MKYFSRIDPIGYAAVKWLGFGGGAFAVHVSILMLDINSISAVTP